MGRAQKLEPGLTHITVRGANMISIAMPVSRRARVAVRGANVPLQGKGGKEAVRPRGEERAAGDRKP